MLAGILHDLGELCVRGGRDGDPPHEEAALSLLEETGIELPEEVSAAISTHHGEKSQGPTGALLGLADSVAAGGDVPAEPATSGQLRGVLSTVGRSTEPDGGYLRPVTLEEADTSRICGEATAEDWDQLQGGLREDLSSYARAASGRLSVTSLFSIVRNFTWSVPAGDLGPDTDVPLAEHLRLTAVLGACMTRRLEEVGLPYGPVSPDLLRQRLGKEEDLAVLLAGDLSGVQNFIYSITS
jgi:CRISPR-associated protein Csm1